MSFILKTTANCIDFVTEKPKCIKSSEKQELHMFIAEPLNACF